MDTTQSPLLVKYLKNYVNNPKSKAFAPLAEAYRKIGKIDKAMELLRDGLKIHQGYISALVTLAMCHQDQKRFDLSYSTLKPVVENNIDNLLLLKTFAKSCEELGYFSEASQSYKYLLFLNPRSQEFADKVKLFDSQDPAVIFDEQKPVIEEVSEQEPEQEQKMDHWEQQSFFKAKESLPEKHLNLVESEQKGTSPNPVMTLTLVDLYCQQGIWDKAKEVLEHILELQPHFKEAQERLQMVQSNMARDLDEGRTHLMNIIDEKLAFKDDISETDQKIEFHYYKFLQQIKLTANSRRSTSL